MSVIKDVRAICTAPAGISLVVVKVETDEPGLSGLGCATFTQRWMAVRSCIEDHLKPLLIGRDPDRIEELWRLLHVNAYWRNGPIDNNALSGVDQALWDIKGKKAGMPVYQLLGGKYREAAAIYRHADGKEPAEILDRVKAFQSEGIRHVRVQCQGYGGAKTADRKPDGALPGAYFDPRNYTGTALAALEHVRNSLGDSIEILHDVHERLAPADAVEFARAVEPLHLFFLEDLFAPEDNGWFENVRKVSATPLAMGELFVHPLEWTPLVTGRMIDFIRMHVSAIGGITPARKAAALAELHGVRTAWHGPGDVSPVGHAANLHLDLATPNFGIQEFTPFNDALKEVFPGCPEVRNGYLYPNDRPGLGIDVNEKIAANYPCASGNVEWTQSRLPDGGLGRP